MSISASSAVLAITSGEPVGVGPELCGRLAERLWPVRLVVLGDLELIEERLARIGSDVFVRDYSPVLEPVQGVLDVLHIPVEVPVQLGHPDPANAPYVLKLLDRALAGCQSGEFAGMVTAPVHKGIICDAGIAFSGHTEYLAQKTGTARVVMMLVGGGMRVALATTHLPLSSVPDALNAAMLEETLRIMHRDLASRFHLSAPRILVAGLNPHAGEGGHMGREEIELITPVLDRLRAEGMRLIGPLPADTLFVSRTLAQGDAVLTLYHDQGLPTLKYASFGGGVNVTLGLPVIRTSVDHGTAFDLAGTGQADPGSLFAAVEMAAMMAGAGN